MSLKIQDKSTARRLLRGRGWVAVPVGVTWVLALLAPQVGLAAKPAPAGHPVARLLAEAESANLRDITVIAVAEPLEREHASGSAALVRLDDGRDGGLPNCWLVELAGRPSAPGKIDAKMRLSVCPGASTKGAQLLRAPLSRSMEAWQVRLEQLRFDSKGGGSEQSILWGLYGKAQGDSETRALWERTSTTFKSRTDPSVNQSEVCQAPQLDSSSQEPGPIAIECSTETTLGKLPKRAKQTFRSSWSGNRYVAQ